MTRKTKHDLIDTRWRLLANVAAGASGIIFIVSLWFMLDGGTWGGPGVVLAGVLFGVGLVAACRAEGAR